MKITINIDEVEGNAKIAFETENKTVDWKDLPDDRQAMAINALYNFTQLFQRAYIDAHMPEFQKVPTLESAEDSTTEEE